MKAFATLFRRLEETADQRLRKDILIDYFKVTSPEEITSSIDFLSGNRPKRLIDMSTLKILLPQMTSLPQWLIDESHSHSGDWAEVISLLIKPTKINPEISLSSWLSEIERLRKLDPTKKIEDVFSAIQSVSNDERYFLTKLITGGSRLKIATALLKQCHDISAGVNQEISEETRYESAPVYKAIVVLLYIKYGRGASVEYSFAIKKGDGLVTLTKIVSGGDNYFDEEVSSFVKNNTIEKFGPVISVKPEMVFEIEFQGVRYSTRHKSGVSLVSPKVNSLLRAASLEDISSIEFISALISD